MCIVCVGLVPELKQCTHKEEKGKERKKKKSLLPLFPQNCKVFFLDWFWGKPKKGTTFFIPNTQKKKPLLSETKTEQTKQKQWENTFLAMLNMIPTKLGPIFDTLNC
jgi:hypothetical protein